MWTATKTRARMKQTSEAQAAAQLKPSGILVLELGHNSLPAVQPLLDARTWTNVGVTNDLAGIAPYFRIVDQDGRTLAAPPLQGLGQGQGRFQATQLRFKPNGPGVYYLVVTDPEGAIETGFGATEYTMAVTGMATTWAWPVLPRRRRRWKSRCSRAHPASSSLVTSAGPT